MRAGVHTGGTPVLRRGDWSQWLGATKFANYGHVGVSITTVTNLVRDGCRDHRPAKPPVGPSVDDLATALANLAPFKVTSPPRDVTPHGYSGKHLELTVPDLSVKRSLGDRFFRGCVDRRLMSWIATNLGGGYWATPANLVAPRSSGSSTPKAAAWSSRQAGRLTRHAKT